jgi:hypothetical protein
MGDELFPLFENLSHKQIKLHIHVAKDGFQGTFITILMRNVISKSYILQCNFIFCVPGSHPEFFYWVGGG